MYSIYCPPWGQPSSWYNIAVNSTPGIHCDFKFVDLIHNEVAVDLITEQVWYIVVLYHTQLNVCYHSTYKFGLHVVTTLL